MRRNNLRQLLLVIAFSFFMAVWTQGFAAEKAPFYQGKTLNFVINFAAGGVTFQLRAWTNRYQGWAQLRSDLAVAINSALAREKIAIA